MNPPEQHLSVVLLALILLLFAIANKAAYQSYFSDDDLNNLALSRFVSWHDLRNALVTPSLTPNFRPAGQLYYRALGATARFHYGAYVATLQALHLATVLLLWLFLRRFGLNAWSVAAGCLFFGLHVSVLPAYWKPMYVFDVLCGFCIMLALLLYQRGHWIASFFCFWLAYKGKEMALFLPAVLLLYECWFGARRWKRLIPFFAASLWWGIQAVLVPAKMLNDYTMHFTFGAVLSSAVFYASKLLLVPYSGIIASAALLLTRRRLILFGVIGFWILLTPMLFFPGRQAGAYLYVPLLAFAMAIGGLAEWKPLWVAAFVAIWLPASYLRLRDERKPILALGHEHRPYVTQILKSLAAHPAPDAIVYDGTPPSMAAMGTEGLLSYALDRWGLRVYSAQDAAGKAAMLQPNVIFLSWNFIDHKLLTAESSPAKPELAYIDFAADNPIWQLGEGWYGLEGYCRWTRPRATLMLRQPRGSHQFSLRLNIGPGQAERDHQLLRVFLEGRPIGEFRFSHSGLQSISWPVSSNKEAVTHIELKVDPSIQSNASRPLGVMICSCGFKP